MLRPPQDLHVVETGTTRRLWWRNPADPQGPEFLERTYAATEVWGAPGPDRTQAKLLAIVKPRGIRAHEGMFFVHSAPAATPWWYWLRSIGVDGTHSTDVAVAP